MSDLPADFTIPAAGEYDYHGLKLGSQYCLEFFVSSGGGIFPTTIDVQFPIGVGGEYVTPENGSFTDTSKAGRLASPSGSIRFVTTGDHTPVKVVLREISFPVS